MSTEQDLFKCTYELMKPGDCLIISNGTLPGEGEEAIVTLDLSGIIPLVDILRVANGTPAEGQDKAPYDNPLSPDPSKVALMLARKKGRFGFDPKDSWFSIGRRLGEISGHTVDIVLVEDIGSSYGFIGKP